MKNRNEDSVENTLKQDFLIEFLKTKGFYYLNLFNGRFG
jgi:hypothetical protein